MLPPLTPRGIAMRAISLALPLLFIVPKASAQVATNYTFSSAAGSYSAISTGTQLWGGILQLDNIDDNISAAQTIPPFNYGGTIQTQMYVSSNGFITFGAAPATNNYTPLSSNAGYTGAISAFGTDLQNTNAPLGLNITQREVRWDYVGTEIVVQWKGMRRKGVSNENFNFQMRLNTSTSVIRFIYGSIAGQGNGITFQPEVGLRGPNNMFATNLNNRLVATGAENWATSLAGTANNSAMRFTTGAPAKVFTNGLTYSWTPNCTQPAATTTVVPNCNTSTYTVQVTVTSIGNAPNVDLVSSVGGLFADNVGLGTYTSPAVAIGTPVTITLIHNTNGICSVPLGPFNPVVACSGTCLTTTLAIPADGCSSNNNLNALVPITFNGTALGVDALLGSVDLIVAEDLLNNSDLQVRLILPAGQSRNLVLSRFGNGTNLGNPSNCPTTVLHLVDGGTALTNSSISNVSGSYAPEQTLAGYTGNPNGVWTLRLCDNGIILSGALKYVKLNFINRGSADPCAPNPITCGSNLVTNGTAGYPNSLPASACAFNGATSTGGVHWWSYTALSTGDVIASTCGTASFDSRISVFLPVPSCSAPTCVATSDDAPGCPGNSSEVTFAATAGQTYLIAVHGSGSASGTYSISLFCQPSCTPGVSNDDCPTALAITSLLADGTGVPPLYNNTCAHVDGPTSVSGRAPAIGLWYTFNSGNHSRHRLHLRGHSFNPAFTASALSYALYSGTCSGLGAQGEVAAVFNSASLVDLPLLTHNTDYRLFIYNRGGISEGGSFKMMVDHPGTNDAGITAVTGPTGVICGSTLTPQAVLKNFGEDTLTNVQFLVAIDAGTPVMVPWTGSLAFGASIPVTLPPITTPTGAHVLHVSIALPNGQADEIASNNTASNSYDASGRTVKVVIHTDNLGAQLTWTIYDSFFFPIATSTPYGNNTVYETLCCLPTTLSDCYSFFLFDSGGDGLCCANGNGGWELREENNRLLLRDRFLGTADGHQSPAISPQTPAYSSGHQFCLPGGPSDILANECGVFTNQLLNKVYSAAVTGATNYQFEFSQPDAGFLRRIAVPRPWVKFSEMVTNPLLPGVSYFARVRVDQGDAGFFDDHFGGGCEMGIDPEQVPGCTQLIDDASLPTFSCGATKAFGGSDKIWARPVVNGTLYKFHFVNIGEGYDRTIQSNNYVCVLNWDTQPLVNGQYQVTVNVLVNGQWSGYCGNACTITIFTPPGMVGAQARIATIAPADSHLLLYPNPTSNGMITLKMDGLKGEQQDIAIVINSMDGKEVMNRQFVHEGDMLNEVLQLDAAMGTGTYILSITINGERTTQRLSVM